jgi:hypothetical protein
VHSRKRLVADVGSLCVPSIGQVEIAYRIQSGLLSGIPPEDEYFGDLFLPQDRSSSRNSRRLAPARPSTRSSGTTWSRLWISRWQKSSSGYAPKISSFNLYTTAVEFLIDKGYDPIYGARPMRRAVEKYLEDPLAEEFLRGNLKQSDTLEVHAAGEQLALKVTVAGAK